MVIVADTFRRDHLGAYGNPYISTPHIDEFARSSVVFDRHVISSIPTMPAVAIGVDRDEGTDYWTARTPPGAPTSTILGR
jgi:Sulfatase